MSRVRIIASNIQLITFITLLILLTIFLVQNTSTIQVNFLIFEMQIPTIILILVATLIGFFGGYVFSVRFRRQHKHTQSVQA